MNQNIFRFSIGCFFEKFGPYALLFSMNFYVIEFIKFIKRVSILNRLGTEI